MNDLKPLIRAHKRQDIIFNVLGIVCTLVGIVTLSALLIDLFVDSLGLLKQYRKPLAVGQDVQLRLTKIGMKSSLQLLVDERVFDFPLDDEAEYGPVFQP